MYVWALLHKTATILGLVEEGAIFHKMSYCKFLWGNPCMAGTFFLSDFGSSTLPFHPVAWKNSKTDSPVSSLHASWYRDGNCNFSTLPVVCHNFLFSLQNSWFVDSAPYFFSPSSSICDNQVRPSSGKSPGHTIPIRSGVSPTLFVFSVLSLNFLTLLWLVSRQTTGFSVLSWLIDNDYRQNDKPSPSEWSVRLRHTFRSVRPRVMPS